MTVAGARPNFVKIAPIQRELAARDDSFVTRLVHTGQHYDAGLSQVFFDQLEITPPAVTLDVGSGSHAQQTAAVMVAFESVLLDWRPDLVVVVGDVNSTLACALVAAKLGIAIAHVEAGLRSFDRSMPEEINRVLTDQLSDLLFTTEQSAHENLRREGIPDERIHFVGNVMIDTLLAHRERARRLAAPARYGVASGEYVLLTLHRPTNVDDPTVFENLMGAIAEIACDVTVLFPVHPRTRPSVLRSAHAAALVSRSRLRLLEPLGYHEFIGLMDDSAAVLTDSGGAQEETTALGIPCLTLRENTERPVTVTDGTNHVVGCDPEAIVAAWRNVSGNSRRSTRPPLWDGCAAPSHCRCPRQWLAQWLALMVGASEPLRIGLLVDTLQQPAWVRQIIADIQASQYARIVLVIKKDGPPRARASLARRIWRRRSRLAYLAYRWLDARVFRTSQDAFAPQDTADLLAEATVVHATVKETRFCDYVSDTAVAEIRDARPDVLLRFGFRILKGPILQAAKYGVWSYHHGDNQVNRGGPAGFWEVMHEHPTTGSVLQILNEDLDNGRVIYRSYAKTDRSSVWRNRNNYYWKSAAFVTRALRQLADCGPAALEGCACGHGSRDVRFYSEPLFRKPDNLETFGLVGRYLTRRRASVSGGYARSISGRSPFRCQKRLRPRLSIASRSSGRRSDRPGPIRFRSRPRTDTTSFSRSTIARRSVDTSGSAD